MIECTQCGEQVPPETTTYRESDGEFAWKCCCACLAEFRVIDKNDPLNDPFGRFATVDEAWRDLLETGEIACLAVPIDSQRIPMDAVITFLPQGAA